MRIAIDIRCLTTPFKTGVAVVTESIIHAMATQSPNDEFILFATGTHDTLMNLPSFTESNITLHTLSIPNKLASLLWMLPLGPTMEYFLPKKPDIWLFPHAHLLKTKLPYSVLFHDAALKTVPQHFTFKDHLRAFMSNEHHIFQHATSVIAVSQHSKNDAIEYYGIDPNKITVAELGVDHSLFLPREQPQDKSYRASYDLNRPYLFCLATKEPRKNIDSVITAYSNWRKQRAQDDRTGRLYDTPIPLVIAGSTGWKTKHIKKALAESSYRNDIHELSYIPEKHKSALYRGATAFIFPSFYEGFGLPVLEAMASGTPVITSITSSLPHLVASSAILIDPLNIQDLTQSLHQLLDSRTSSELQSLLRNRGIERAKEFSWEKTATIILETLKRNLKK